MLKLRDAHQDASPFEVRMRAKTSGNADRIELRELTELLEEALGEREPSEAPGSE